MASCLERISMRLNNFWLFSKRNIPWQGNYTKRRNALIEDSLKRISDSSLNQKFVELVKLRAPFGVGLDERVIEIPWVASKIQGKRILLDAGCAFFKFACTREMVGLEHEVHLLTLDERDFPTDFKTSNIKYHLKDLRADIGLNNIEIAICVSTIEHVGLDNTLLYTNDDDFKENSPTSYLEAIEVLIDSVKIDGEILLTVPYGIKADLVWLQIFDESMIKSIVENPRLQCEELLVFKHNRRKGWIRSSLHDANNAEYYDYHLNPEKASSTNFAAAEAVVLLHLKKIKK